MKKREAEQQVLYFDAYVSQFAGITPRPLQVTPTVKEVVGHIRESELLKSDIEKAREALRADIAEDERKNGKLLTPTYDACKKRLPAVTWAGTFKTRNNNSLISPSGFLSFDVDPDKKQLNFDYELERKRAHEVYKALKEDPYVAFLFGSVSAIGLKGLVKIPATKSDAVYKSYFRALQGYLKSKYSIALDSLPDISRLCFLSHQDNPHLNQDAKLFSDRQDASSKAAPERGHKTTIKDPSMKAAVKILLHYGIQREIGRGEFVGLCGAAKRSGLSYETFDRIMQKSPGYDRGNNFKIWNTVDPDDRDQAKTGASLIKIAREINLQMFRAFRKECAKKPGQDDSAAPGLATLIKTKLAQRYSFRLNKLSDKVLVKMGEEKEVPITDYIESEVRCWLLDQGFGRREAITDVIRMLAYANTFHPVQEYLDRLKWDKQDHIAVLSKYFSDRDNLFPLYLRKWLIGAVGKVLYGTQNPMLVLMGGQGIGKGYFARWLCPIPELFISSAICPEIKDHQLRACDRWIWEVVELGSTTRRADIEALKAFLTQEVFTIRRPYGHFDIDKPVTASFIGTVNDEGSGILTDTTGNRRYRPLYVEDMGWGYAGKIDIHQVWSQAKALFDSGERVTLDDNEEGRLRHEVLPSYMRENPLEDLVREHFIADSNQLMGVTDIMNPLYNMGYKGKTTRADSMDLASVMKSLGIEKARSEKKRGYRCRFVSPIRKDRW